MDKDEPGISPHEYHEAQQYSFKARLELVFQSSTITSNDFKITFIRIF
jgi:hypothetical protein